MTTYTSISATEVQSGKPITESLMTRLANNLEAVVEGDPTAPIIHPSIMPQGSDGLKLSASRSGSWLQSTGGGYYEYILINYNSVFSASILCNLSTTYTFSGGGGSSFNLQMYLDGTLIDSSSTSSSSGTWSFNYSLPSGSHALSFRARNQFGNDDSTFSGSLVASGEWL